MLDFLIKVFTQAFFFEVTPIFYTTILHLFPCYFMKHHPRLIPQKFKTILHILVFLDF